MATFLAATLPGILLPLLLAAGSCAIVLAASAPGESRRWAWLAGSGGGLAYLAGHVAINGWPELMPAESSQWLFHLVLAATVVGVMEVVLDLAWPARLALRVVVVGGLSWLTLRPLVHHSWSTSESVLLLPCLAVFILLVLFSTDTLAGRDPASFQVTVWLCTAGVGGVVLLLSGSARLGQMGGAIAAALLPAAALLGRRFPTLPAGALTALVVAFAGVWLNGAFYTEMHPAASLAVALAPLAAWAGEAPWSRTRSQRRLIVAGLAVSLLLLAALGVAVADSLGAAQEDPYYD